MFTIVRNEKTVKNCLRIFALLQIIAVTNDRSLLTPLVKMNKNVFLKQVKN